MPLIDYVHNQSKIRPKETLQKETQRVIRSLVLTLGIMIAVLSIVFLATTSNNAEKGYNLTQAQLKNESLRDESNDLTMKITDTTAFSKLEENENIEKMTETEVKSYVTDKDNEVK